MGLDGTLSIANPDICSLLRSAPVAGGGAAEKSGATACDLKNDAYLKIKENTFKMLNAVITSNSDISWEFTDQATGERRLGFKGCRLPKKVLYELLLIRWLLLREIGYNWGVGKTLKSIESEDFPDIFQYTDEITLAPLLDDRRFPDAPFRINYWRARIALILANDIDNPSSRRLLRMRFGEGQPHAKGFVFGIAIPNIPDNQPMSRQQKFEIFRDIYDKLIAPKGGKIKALNDPLVEAEALIAQYFYADSAPAGGPSRDYNYLQTRIEKVLGDTAQLDKMPSGNFNVFKTQYFLGLADEYIASYIRDRSNPIKKDITSYDRMRPEAYRYRAQALKLQAQLLMINTPNHHPFYVERLKKIAALLKESQELVNKYVMLTTVAEETQYKTIVINSEDDKIYSDLINVLDTEVLGASALYQLGLAHSYLPGEAAASDSQRYLNRAQTMAEHAERLLGQAATQYQAAIKVNGRRPIEGTKFWRDSITADLQLLKAEIILAQKDAANAALDIASGILTAALNKQDFLTAEQTLKARLSLAEIAVRRKLPEEKKVTGLLRAATPLFDPAYDPLTDTKGARALAILQKTEPFDRTKLLAGPVRLAQTKALLALGQQKKDEKILSAVLKLADELIAAARPDGKFGPSLVSDTEYTPPNNGVLADYQLSAALQIRGDAYLALSSIPEAGQNYEAAISVFSSADGIALNYFAAAGRADIYNWTMEYDNAIDAYDKLIKDPRLIESVRDAAQLGRAEAVLRQQFAKTSEGADNLADEVIGLANAILDKKDSEAYLRRRAEESLVEALIAKRSTGVPQLIAIADNLLASQGEGASRSIYLRVVEGMLYSRNFDRARSLFDAFSSIFKTPEAGTEDDLRLKVARAEFSLYQRSYPASALEDLIAAAKTLAALPKQKADVFLASRIIKGLILYYNGNKDYDLSLKEIDAALAEKSAIGAIFKARGVSEARVNEFISELRVEKGKVLSYAKRFDAALKYLGALKPDNLSPQYRVEYYILQGNIYTYGRGKDDAGKRIKDPAKARANYETAMALAGKLESVDLKNYYLAKIQLGYAQLALEERRIGDFRRALSEVKPYLPGIATLWRRELIERDLRRLRRALGDDSQVRLGVEYFGDDQGNHEFRLTEELGYTFNLASEMTLRPFLKMTTDIKAGAVLQSYYSGLEFSPVDWVGLDADGRLASHFLSGDRLLQQYLRRHDTGFGLRLDSPFETAGLQGLTSYWRAELDNANRELGTYYANLFYTVGQDTDIEALERFSVGAEYSYYRFPYNGSFPSRNRITLPSLKYVYGFLDDALILRPRASFISETGIDYEWRGNERAARRVANFGLAGGLEASLSEVIPYVTPKLSLGYQGVRQDMRKNGDYKLPVNSWNAGFVINFDFEQ
ncbi:hypothetical protein A3D23_04525 [candidate division WOR-1 bacterium RIFCSPHIGHO2_02_FULL_53_26]|nr:MAG: hypothetical protein A3D23_04525 [candidate division WOR-1 bacterium RIFCSPHIGHO2_02_FULL_53_26]